MFIFFLFRCKNPALIRSIISLGFLCVLLPVYSQTSQPARPFLNMGMEIIDPVTALPKGWMKGDFNNLYTLRVDSTVSHSGRYSLLIHKTGKGPDAYISNKFSIPFIFKGDSITISGFLKTAELSGEASIWIEAIGKNNSSLGFYTAGSTLNGNSEWQKFTITIPFDAYDTESIDMGSSLEGSGKVWLDDLALTVDGKEIQSAPLYVGRKGYYKAEDDTAFIHGSRIEIKSITDAQLKNLINLGKVWGFLKYHHPEIAKGNYNWDAELFRVMPAVIAAPSTQKANEAIEQWLDKIPIPLNCKNCSELKKDSSIIRMPGYGDIFKKGNLSQSLIKKLTYILNNRNYKTHYYISFWSMVHNPEFRHEAPYAEMTYPDAGYRLLALFRYWNIIQYFYPNRHLTDENWNTILPGFIPIFIHARDTFQYEIACTKLIVRLKDTHASMGMQVKKIALLWGKLLPPVQVTFINKQLVITGYYTNDTVIRNNFFIGDIITMLDGRPVNERVKELLETTTGSNIERQLATIRLVVLRSDKTVRELEITRDDKKLQKSLPMYAGRSLNFAIDRPAIPDSSYQILKGNIGYVYPGKYKNAQLPGIKKAFADVKGMIIDLRCYPSEFMPFTFGSYIKQDSSVFVTFRETNLLHPGLFIPGKPLKNGGQAGADVFTKKIVVIVNETTLSQAEYTAIAFQSSPNVIVIGSKTAGADGNISPIILPGNITTNISGIGIYYPDGTETQRVGVRIDIPVKPTIKGIKEGRDELLEKAIAIINN